MITRAQATTTILKSAITLNIPRSLLTSATAAPSRKGSSLMVVTDLKQIIWFQDLETTKKYRVCRKWESTYCQIIREAQRRYLTRREECQSLSKSESSQCRSPDRVRTVCLQSSGSTTDKCMRMEER